MRQLQSYLLTERSEEKTLGLDVDCPLCLSLGSVESLDWCEVRESIWLHSREVISINEAPVLKLSSQIRVQGPWCSGRYFQMVTRLLPAILMLQMWQHQHFCFQHDVTMDFPWNISENYEVSLSEPWRAPDQANLISRKMSQTPEASTRLLTIKVVHGKVWTWN